MCVAHDQTQGYFRHSLSSQTLRYLFLFSRVSSSLLLSQTLTNPRVSSSPLLSQTLRRNPNSFSSQNSLASPSLPPTNSPHKPLYFKNSPHKIKSKYHIGRCWPIDFKNPVASICGPINLKWVLWFCSLQIPINSICGFDWSPTPRNLCMYICV